ncbi:hypothetical protein COCMIDRAFT_38117 [Bipolaris oryzae ATCC 44560]|uniref:Uncharacterized protein n=1 Tax=Bipolaris oryzae ATCC 44560 TaxID=930090 RepID=W6ZK86_COCMI|nr:uncharacterized protein COCMIDRAFT_38117 [Bipolaris oryzae ATCC 44560]EUC43991.1 hypothetical protein COCMIDRAFT_38117 [Bipolaris oryzae ATCC 44560]
MTYQQPLPCNIAVSDRYLSAPTVRLLYPPHATSAALSTHSPSFCSPKSNPLPPFAPVDRCWPLTLVYTTLSLYTDAPPTLATKVALMCAVSYDLHIYLHQSTWWSSRPQPYLRPSATTKYARLLAEKSNFALGKQDGSGDVKSSIEPSGLWPRPFPSLGKPIRCQSR